MHVYPLQVSPYVGSVKMELKIDQIYTLFDFHNASLVPVQVNHAE